MCFDHQKCGGNLGESAMAHKPSRLLEEVLTYIDHSHGLSSTVRDDGVVSVSQAVDGRVLNFAMETLQEVLQRVDADGKGFIQINFTSGQKVLFTDTLIGFKPLETPGLDMGRIPKVVTTPDLISVFEAIEETLSSDESEVGEAEILKKVFTAILGGGEAAGFDLCFERKWLSRLTASKYKASA